MNAGLIHKTTGVPFRLLISMNDEGLFRAIEDRANELIKARTATR